MSTSIAVDTYVLVTDMCLAGLPCMRPLIAVSTLAVTTDVVAVAALTQLFAGSLASSLF